MSLELSLISISIVLSSGGSTTTRKCSQNMWSTVITIVAAVIGFAVLYDRFWYPDRIRNVIEISQDSVVSIPITISVAPVIDHVITPRRKTQHSHPSPSSSAPTGPPKQTSAVQPQESVSSVGTMSKHPAAPRSSPEPPRASASGDGGMRPSRTLRGRILPSAL